MRTHRSVLLFHLILLSIMASVSVDANPPELNANQLASPPPKIIRPCCSFGSDVKMAGLPFMKITAITSLDQEQNGIVYTQRGGFIDLGHLRDNADWTAYIFSLMQSGMDGEMIKQKLGNEGGQKMLWLEVPDDIDRNDQIAIAGRIAFDLSIWHEIATWFGASYIPMLPERYSSFSAEDLYSNLLGVQLGIAAIQSELPYEVAMTQLLKEKLEELGVVDTETETYTAMEAVEGVWWTREKKIPSRKLLLLRYLDIDTCLHPWLIKEEDLSTEPHALCIQTATNDGRDFSNFYQLSFRLNSKFPIKKIFPFRIERRISQSDFPILMQWIAAEIETDEYKEMNKMTRKGQRNFRRHYKQDRIR